MSIIPSVVSFEVAALADAMKRAAAIAPMKGAGFDKAAGVVLEVDADNQSFALRATNLDVFFLEWVEVNTIEGDNARWRLPSRVLNDFIASLPIGSNRTVTFTDQGSSVKIQSNRAVCELRKIEIESYPDWWAYDEDGMTLVTDLGQRVSQVQWAADRSVPSLGVRITGTDLLATNRYVMAASKLEVSGLEAPITIPPLILDGVLKDLGDTKIKVVGNQLFVSPDDHTQLQCRLIAEPFPSVELIMAKSIPEEVVFDRLALLDIVQRAGKIGTDRIKQIKVIIGQGEIAAMNQDDEVGKIGDVISLGTQAQHRRFTIKVNPDYLSGVLTNSPNNQMTLNYDSSNPNSMIIFDGGSGYRAWLVPIKGEQ